MKRFFAHVGAVALMAGLLAALPTQANAAGSQEPIVDLSNMAYRTASFKADGRDAASASLTASTGAKVVLNVHVNPMPRKRTAGCWTVMPGMVISNEVIDPATGQPGVIDDWVVPASDNTFCHKKGAGKQVFKKSCGNRVWGVPGGPMHPPRNLPRIKGKVVVQDYLKFAGKIAVSSHLRGSAMAHVVQYDDAGNKVCEAKASVRGSADAVLHAWIRVKSRTQAGINIRGGHRAEMKLSTNTKASGKLRGLVKTKLSGKAMAMCNYAPPSSGSIVEVTDVNDVRYGQTYNWRIRGIVPEGQTATLRVSAQRGALPESDKTWPLGAGSFDIIVHYTAPTEGSSDTLTAKLFGSDGVKDDEKSDTFDLLPNPVDPQ